MKSMITSIVTNILTGILKCMQTILLRSRKKIRFSYLMHTVFVDGRTFSFEDLVRMEEDGFFTRYEITF